MQNYKKIKNIILTFFLVFGFIFINSFTTNAATWKKPTDSNNDILTFYFHFKSNNNQWEEKPYFLSMKSKNNTNYIFESEGIQLQTNKSYTSDELKNLGFKDGFGNVFQLDGEYPSNAYQPLSQKLDMVAIRLDNLQHKEYSLNLCGATTFPLFQDELPEEASASISFELKEIAVPQGSFPINDDTPEDVTDDDTLKDTLDDELSIAWKKSTKENDSFYKKLSIRSEKKRDYEVYDSTGRLYQMKDGTFDINYSYKNYNEQQKNDSIIDENIKKYFIKYNNQFYSIDEFYAVNEPITIGKPLGYTYLSYDCKFKKNNDITLDIDNPFIQISGIKNLTYHGENLEQNNLKVFYVYPISPSSNGLKELEEGKDYKIQYENNIETGTANIIITGKGDYIGKVTKSFQILPKSITPDFKLSKTTFIYNGKVQKPQIINNTPINSYTIINQGGITPGTYHAKIVMNGNYTGSKTIPYKITLNPTKFKKIKVGKKLVKLYWNKQTPNKYQIQYSAKSNFKNKKSIIVSGKSKKKITHLAKKKYYFRIRTVLTNNGKTYYSTWSKIKKVKIK